MIEIASALSHPEVSRAGLTTTADGEWALLIRVRPDTRTPIPYIEDASAGFPVIYQDEPERPVIARPAFPAKGE